MNRFVTFEGGEGAGKSTQARLLADALRAQGREVLLTREPGGTPGAATIRKLLLDPDATWPEMAEVLLHFAARADHIAQLIRPALDRGAWVICDRFADSTMAYQGQASGRELIALLTARLPVQPAWTIILDVDAATRRVRLASRGNAADRYEQRDDAFHARVAATYREIAAGAPDRCLLISGEGDPTAIHARILQRVGAMPQTPLAPAAPDPRGSP